MAKIEIYVVPQEGRTVPDPARSDVLPVEGRLVVRDPYWIRRIEDKDVAVAKQGTGKAGSGSK
ncbi:hypothetical protein A7P23_11420 [Achromobacter xylosoxidans]|nr:hypothetical protein A7P23_11420 [Achromobacter xylosoxidans]